MKLGYASAILPDQSFEFVIDFAAANGFDCVEAMCWPKGRADRRYAGVTHIDVDTLDPGEADRIGDYLLEKGVFLSALGYYPNPLDPDYEVSATAIGHIKKVILAARMLGVGTVNTFIGRDQHRSVSENMVEFKKVWPDIVDFAQGNGVRIAIENCPMLFTEDEWPGGKNLATTPNIWREMFSVIDSEYFGLNYDPSHLLWQQMDYLKPIGEFGEKFFHVHIKDAKVYKEKLNEVGIFAPPLSFHSPKLPGLGDIDWGAFLSALRDIRYDGAVVIEVEDRAYEDTLEDRLRAVTQSKRYISQYL